MRSHIQPKHQQGGLASDHGSAVAESVMVMALIALLFAAILQFGVIIYTRNTMIDAANAGARHATMADRDINDGKARTEQLLNASLPGTTSAIVLAHQNTTGDGQLVTVTVQHQIPMIGFISGPVPLEVTGRAHIYD